MRTREDLESYFIQMGIDYEEVDDEMWVLKQDGSPGIVCIYSPPVVVLRLKIMDLPAGMEDVQLAGLFRRLLELNAGDLLHGSYGLEENEVVLSDALELENLDFSEVRSSFESMLFAASTHLTRLAELVPAGREG